MKKILHDQFAVKFHHASFDFNGVVEIGIVEDIKFRDRAAADRIGHAPDHLLNTGEHQRTGAHGARLLRDIHDRPVEPPVSNGLCGLCDGENFRVRSGIVQGFGLVMRLADHFVVEHNNGTARDFTLGGSLLRFAQRHAHINGFRRKVVHSSIPIYAEA